MHEISFQDHHGDICGQPAQDAGDCDEWVIKYSYDSDSRSCKAYYYGGCGGNENRFDSLDDCESRCIHRDAEPGKFKKKLKFLKELLQNSKLKKYFGTQSFGVI